MEEDSSRKGRQIRPHRRGSGPYSLPLLFTPLIQPPLPPKWIIFSCTLYWRFSIVTAFFEQTAINILYLYSALSSWFTYGISPHVYLDRHNTAWKPCAVGNHFVRGCGKNSPGRGRSLKGARVGLVNGQWGRVRPFGVTLDGGGRALWAGYWWQIGSCRSDGHLRPHKHDRPHTRHYRKHHSVPPHPTPFSPPHNPPPYHHYTLKSPSSWPAFNILTTGSWPVRSLLTNQSITGA